MNILIINGIHTIRVSNLSFFSHTGSLCFRSLSPPIDASQDWQLVNGSENDGATVLEFTRKLTTCDDKDLDIKVALITQYYINKIDEHKYTEWIWNS